MKAFGIFIEKKQTIFLNNPITKNKNKQKAKQNVTFQLRQFSIFFHENLMAWSLG